MSIVVMPSAVQRPDRLPDTPPTKLLTLIPEPTGGAWNQQAHPGYGLTANILLAAYHQAEYGYTWQQADVFADVIESDGHLRAQLEGRLDGVAGKPWMVIPGGDKRIDEVAAQELEGALRDVPVFADTIGHQLKKNWHGYSASEIEWKYTQGVVAPVFFADAPHRRIIFDWQTTQPKFMTGLSMDGLPLEPGGWWFTTRRLSSHVPARAGLMRTAAWWALFKRMQARDWQVFAARFGLPYVSGQYVAGASSQDKETLRQAVRKLGTDGGSIYQEGNKLEIHTVQHGGKAGDIQGSIIALCNAELSKLITGSTLTTETGGPGSFALGEVHANVAFELRASDAEKLSASFEQAIGAPFVKWNGMTGARPPRLKINLVRDMAPLTRVQILSILSNNMGVKLSLQQVRTEFQLKAPLNTADEVAVVAPIPIGTNP